MKEYEGAIWALKRSAEAKHGLVLQPLQVAEIWGTLVAMGQEIQGMQMYIAYANETLERFKEKYGEQESLELEAERVGVDPPLEGQQVIAEITDGVADTPDEEG